MPLGAKNFVQPGVMRKIKLIRKDMKLQVQIPCNQMIAREDLQGLKQGVKLETIIRLQATLRHLYRREFGEISSHSRN